MTAGVLIEKLLLGAGGEVSVNLFAQLVVHQLDSRIVVDLGAVRIDNLCHFNFLQMFCFVGSCSLHLYNTTQ
nr:MAG TPA: hypothetical protein [Caudoviricetes sp.]